MELKKMRTKVVSAALAGVMGLSVCSPVLAMASEGDTASSNITIEAEASTINVTVPTNAAFVFKGDGTNVYPSNHEVTNNNALTAVTLNSIDFEGVNGWSLTTEDDTFQADQKKFALWMGARDNELSAVDVNDGVVFSGNTEIKIAPNASKVLDFQAKRGVYSSPITTENAMKMTMHFDWEKGSAPQMVEKVNLAYKAYMSDPYFNTQGSPDENSTLVKAYREAMKVLGYRPDISDMSKRDKNLYTDVSNCASLMGAKDWQVYVFNNMPALVLFMPDGSALAMQGFGSDEFIQIGLTENFSYSDDSLKGNLQNAYTILDDLGRAQFMTLQY